MFKLLRYYSITSFVAILATALLLTWFYRRVAIEGIFQLAERGNLNLAQVAMNPIKADLLTFLRAAADVKPGGAVPPLPASLSESIATLMHDDHFVAKIKIYNLQGVVIFSTERAQVGEDQSTNDGFRTASRGQVISDLVYRDTFNSFDEATEEDNLVQTYLPIRATPVDPVHGVFELYGDVNNLMHQAERMQFIIIAGAIPILLALYAVLVLLVRYANRTIEEQQRTIHERNETLAMMSAHMLRTEESQKKQIAFDLHEGVAQTLALLKLKAESGRRSPRPSATDEPVDSMIPMLQEAIQEVRTIATELRPSSLDDFGLLATLDSLARESEQQHPGILLERRYSLREDDVPAPLKGILYRVVVSVLADMARQTGHGRIRLALGLENDALVLVIDTTPLEPADGSERQAAILPRLRPEFRQMEELATLSGGRFTASQRLDGGISLRAAWKLA